MTCVVKNDSKSTKVYESESYKDLLKLIKCNNIGDYKLKYVRKMSSDDQDHSKITIFAKQYKNLP